MHSLWRWWFFIYNTMSYNGLRILSYIGDDGLGCVIPSYDSLNVNA